MWGTLIAKLSLMVQTKAGQWVTAILLSLGIGIATHQGIVAPALETALEYIQDQASTTDTLGQVAIQWFAFFNFDKAITMILGAYGSRAAVRAGKAFLARR